MRKVETVASREKKDLGRRNFLRKSLAYATGAVASTSFLGFPQVMAKKRTVWRLVLSVPKTLPIWGTGVEDFAKKVKVLSRGEMEIRVYGANELVPAFGVFEAVKKGTVQMGHSTPYYWMGKIPASPFFSGIPFGMSLMANRNWMLAGAGQKLWEELYAPHNILPFLCGSTTIQMGGWFKKEIRSIKDMKGLKMRIPGLGGKVLERVGVKPIVVPGGEIFTNLSTGVIDAAEWVGPYHDYIMGFYKVASYYYYPGWHEPGVNLELTVHRKAWDSLPNHLKECVRCAAATADKDITSLWLSKDAEYFEKIKKMKKIKILPFPPSLLKSLRKHSYDVIEELAASSPMAGKIYKSYRDFQKRFEQYEEITSGAYRVARKAKY